MTRWLVFQAPGIGRRLAAVIAWRALISSRGTPVLRLIGLALGASLLTGLVWGLNRTESLPPAPGETAQSAMPALPAPAPLLAEKALIEWHKAAAFSTAPFARLPMIAAPLEPVLGKDFRELLKLPPSSRQDAPPLDPRKLRALMDRGVVIYAGSGDDKNRQKGAELIQTAALLGFSPARRLIVRNYPISETVRRAVPARDAISYTLDFFTASEIDSEDSKGIFVSLAEHFAHEGQIEFFAAHLLAGLRGDTRPQLSHRMDTMLELLARVRGACLAVARIVSQPAQSTDDTCSVKLAGDLRRFVETGRPIEREGDLRRRGLIMLDQAAVR